MQRTEVTGYNHTNIQLVRSISFQMVLEENSRVSDLELSKINMYFFPKVVEAQALQEVTFEDISFLFRCMLPVFWETLSLSV